MEDQITLVEAAIRLKSPYQDVHRLLLTGKIRGQKSGSRWSVSAEDVERVRRERQDGTPHPERVPA